MAITLTYLYPVAGSTPPSQAVMKNFNMLVATIGSSSAADNSAVITHDFNFGATALANGFPRVVINPQGDDVTSVWYVTSQNPNYTLLGSNVGGVTPSTLFTIDRPFSMDR